MSEKHHPIPDEEAEIPPAAPLPDMGPADVPSGSVDLFGLSDYAKVVEYAPGKRAVVCGIEAVPRFGVVRWEHVGRGEWRPRLVGWGQKIALRKFHLPSRTGGEPHPVLRSLGLDLSYNSVLRLWKSGFISGTQPVPCCILIDLSSLARHLREAEDPDFWTEERKRRFREVMR